MFSSSNISVDGRLAMLRVDGGYIDGGGLMHYYVTDYQGNITRTVSSFGYEQQSISYYPDGEPWIEPTGENPFMFGGKERITFGGLRQYDFGARILNTTTGAWWQQDSKAEDYLDITPYSFCGGDPVNRIDPDGKKIYYINMEGRPITPNDDIKIGSFSKADYEKYVEDLDQIIVVGDDGKLCGTTECLPENTIEGTITIKLTENQGFGFVVRGDENGKHIFKTLSKIITGKNDIEFSHIMAGEKDELGLNFVTTSHTKNKEASAYRLIYTQLKFGYTLREIDHSHSSENYASKPDRDFKFYVKILVSLFPNLKFNIYHVPTGNYYPY